MSFKRERPKNRRAGCLMCKPWKGNGMQRKRWNVSYQERKGQIAERDEKTELEGR